ncbi:MAG TPA: GNAT family N-acetyltransferase [Stellaceae bacterium]|nr:GNAT family N-acetyltransferase [Stellaceae bacterium]
MAEIAQIAAIDDPSMRRELLELLADAVEGGASVGFTLPFDRERGISYWGDVACDLVSGLQALLVARDEKGKIVGAVQLGFTTRQNGRHRAEMQKLLVRKSHRRRGLARQLIAAAEDLAAKRGIRLITLDTRLGDEAEVLYQKLDYTRAGIIPDYISDGHGHFHATALYYKLLAA